MDLKILLPFKVFADVKNVEEVIIETSEGSYGFLPQRLDCVAAVVPGILTYKSAKNDVNYVAVDTGLMVKAGDQVLVSVRNAVGGSDLGKLGGLIQKDFTTQQENEKEAISVVSKLERGFIYSFDKLSNY